MAATPSTPSESSHSFQLSAVRVTNQSGERICRQILERCHDEVGLEIRARLTPIALMPARRAASIPATASSTTTQRSGGTPTAAAALRKTCGSGLPAVTSSAETIASSFGVAKHPQHHSDVGPRRRRAMACFQPAAWRVRSHSAAPGSGVSPRSWTSRRYAASLASPTSRMRSRRRLFPEPAGQNAIVFLSERIEELLIRDGVAFGSERVPPRQCKPVSPAKIPENGAREVVIR